MPLYHPHLCFAYITPAGSIIFNTILICIVKPYAYKFTENHQIINLIVLCIAKFLNLIWSHGSNR